MTTTIADTFPKLELTLLPTDRKPTAADIKLLKKEIYANAMAIPSICGGGALGHVALCMLAGDYIALPAAANTAWVDPVHPGQAPVIPNNATAAQITEINHQFKAEEEEFKVFKATEASIRKCLTRPSLQPTSISSKTNSLDTPMWRLATS